MLFLADWVTCSPKLGMPMVLNAGTEIKIVLPGGVSGLDWSDEDLVELGRGWGHKFVQPNSENPERAIAFVRAHPEWRLSVQLHKVLRLP